MKRAHFSVASRAWLVVASAALASCLSSSDRQNHADAVDAGADLNARFRPWQDGTVVDDWQITKPTDTVDAQPGDAPNEDTHPAVDATETLVDAADDATSTCGNGACGDGESCATCSADCGTCPPWCGDGVCNGGEACGTCPADCGACPPPACAPLDSAGCPPGEQCFPDPGGNLCATVGVLTHGKPCEAWNACVAGALCVAGACRTLCDATGKNAALLCKPGVPCEKLVFAGAGEVGGGLGACKPGDNCNGLDDTGCPDGKACIPSGWLKTCTPPGSVAVGAACTASAQCQLGHLCVGKPGLCKKKCHTAGGKPACATGNCEPVLGPDNQPVPEYVGTCG